MSSSPSEPVREPVLDEDGKRPPARRGRPPRGEASPKEHAIRLALAHGYRLAPDAVYLLGELMRGLHNATPAVQMQAADSILDRFGLPRRTQGELVGELPLKLFDFRGYEPAELAANGHEGAPTAH